MLPFDALLTPSTCKLFTPDTDFTIQVIKPAVPIGATQPDFNSPLQVVPKPTHVASQMISLYILVNKKHRVHLPVIHRHQSLHCHNS